MYYQGIYKNDIYWYEESKFLITAGWLKESHANFKYYPFSSDFLSDNKFAALVNVKDFHGSVRLFIELKTINGQVTVVIYTGFCLKPEG